MKGILRLVATLVTISVVAAVGLAWVHERTAAPIRAAIRQDTLRAIAAVLPAYDNAPDLDQVEVAEQRYYPARTKGQLVGLALPVHSAAGYGGDLSVLLGLSPAGTVTGVQILAHAETPGLGAKCTDPAYLAQFVGKTLDGARWRVKKDGGAFDQITGATITPRALLKALEGGLQTYQRDRAQVLAAVGKVVLTPAGEDRP